MGNIISTVPLAWDEEETLLKSLEQRAIAGELLTAKHLLPEISKAVGQEVSLGYVYSLLQRHRWRKLGPRPRHVKAKRETQEEFKKTARTHQERNSYCSRRDAITFVIPS